MKLLHLKKYEDKRLRAGHVWIYSNEINTQASPLKQFVPGEEVQVLSHSKAILGTAYVNPNSLITARLFSRETHATLNTAFFVERLRAALALRSNLFKKPYYRLVFGEADGLPGLVVDRFNDVFSLQLNTAGMDAKTNQIIEACKEIFSTNIHILLRNDSPIRLQEGLNTFVAAAWGSPPETVIVEENGAIFQAPLWHGQKTGWFYDHRLNRARLTDYVAGRTVLDIFSYLGGWSIPAAKWGATQVTCIDSSSLASQWTMQNATINQVSERINVIEQEAFDALKQLNQAKKSFEVIVLDPPAFIKKQKDKTSGLLAYQRINELAMKLLPIGGILISCSCSMQVSLEELMQILLRASFKTHIELQVLERGHQGPDHPLHLAIPETDYLKMILLRRVK